MKPRRSDSDPEPRFLLLMNSLAGGGAERSVLLLASALSSIRSTTLMVCRHEGPYANESASSVSLEELGVWPSPRNFITFAIHLARRVPADVARILITNGFGLNQMVLAARWSNRADERILVVERSTLSAVLVERFRSRGVRWFVRLLTRFLYRQADAIVGVSEGVARDLERTLRLPHGSVHTIYNPIDVARVRDAVEGPVPEELSDRFLGLPRPIILTVGRLVTLKGQADLITAFAALPERQRGSLIILGEGPLRSELVKQTEQLGIADRVWMPGFVTNPWWFIGRADLFCLSSHHEGHPRVLLEALACGTPVVSTDCPHGPRETLTGVDAARLTPVADTPALTAAISDLLDERPTVNVDLTRYHPTHIAHQYAALAQVQRRLS